MSKTSFCDAKTEYSDALWSCCFVVLCKFCGRTQFAPTVLWEILSFVGKSLKINFQTDVRSLLKKGTLSFFRRKTHKLFSDIDALAVSMSEKSLPSFLQKAEKRLPFKQVYLSPLLKERIFRLERDRR